MSRKGNCWDNAVSESFFGTIKKEMIYLERFATRESARRAIFEYIEIFYDRIPLHLTINFMSSDDFEQKMETAA
jgi:transposase InsO family protein